MQANWSLALNILLLMAVLFSIVRLVKTRRQSLARMDVAETPEPAMNHDEIIAIRKLNTEETTETIAEINPQQSSVKAAARQARPFPKYKDPAKAVDDSIQKETQAANFMMFLLARENRQFAGYELLQTLLAAGLRFGEGQLFHRHQFANGQGPILCSLAAATQSGLFDLQNIGAFSVRGLCLFMEASGNAKIDEERFTIMLDTARQLSEGLDALLLDDMRRPLTDQRIARYYELLNLHALI